MQFRAIWRNLAACLMLFSASFIIPIVTGFIIDDANSIVIFTTSGLLILSLGFFLNSISSHEEMGISEAMLFVSIAWIVTPLVGTIPYLFYGFSVEEAVFEICSGFSTSGLTIIPDLNVYNEAFHVYRTLSCWLGGIGIILMFIVLAPAGARAGLRISQMDISISAGKMLPRVRDIGIAWVKIYVMLTLLQILTMHLLGVSFYESVVYSFSTIPTCGFASRNSSAADFSPEVKAVMVLFMILGAAPFWLHFAVLTLNRFYTKSEEFRWFIIITFAGCAVMFVDMYSRYGDFVNAAGYGTFDAVSTITTSGFCVHDTNEMPQLTRLTMVLLMLIGACAGGTAGGIKIPRFVLLAKWVAAEFRRLARPNQIVLIRVDGEVVPKEIVERNVVFVTMYLFIFVAGAIGLFLIEGNIEEGFTMCASSMGNVGLGIGRYSSHCHDMHPSSKIICSYLMMLGRVEIIPLLVVFSPLTWRK